MQKNIMRLKRHLKTAKQENVVRVVVRGIGVPGPKDHYSNPPTVSS